MEKSSTMKRSQVLKRAARDIFVNMPGIAILLVVLRLARSVLIVVQVSAVAGLVDEASRWAEGAGNLQAINGYVWQVVLSFISTQITGLLEYRLTRIDTVPKDEYYHHRMSRGLAHMSLEATLQPNIYDRFWQAKQALWQQYVTEVFFSAIQILPLIIQLGGIALVLARYHVALVAVAFVSVFPAALVAYLLNKKEYTFTKEQTALRRRVEYFWRLLTAKETIRESRLFGFGPYLTDKYHTLHAKNVDAAEQMGLKRARSTFLADLIKHVIYAGGIGLTIYFVIDQRIGIGAFAASLTAFVSLQGSAQQLLHYVADVAQYADYASDYYQFLNLSEDPEGGTETPAEFKTLEAEKISYTYPEGNHPAVNQVSLSMGSTGLYVIVGANGSGKTTLSRLLLGLYQPSEGRVLLNGRPLSEYDRTKTWRICSIMAQDFGRYALTFYDNIGLGDLDRMAHEPSYEAVIQDVDLQQVLQNVGGGETMLGVDYGGRELSGGEWQKLALARSIFRSSDLIIFDEPTGAIDPMVEDKVLQKIIELSADRSCLVISHRVGICRSADMIYVMSDGAIIQEGTHTRLMQDPGVYREMWHAQAQWYQEKAPAVSEA